MGKAAMDSENLTARIRKSLGWALLVGILIPGSAILVAACFDYIQIRNDNRIAKEQDAYQIAVIEILHDELEIHKRIGTTQADRAPAGPTATAAAEAIAQLRSTQGALEKREASVQTTLTAMESQIAGKVPLVDRILTLISHQQPSPVPSARILHTVSEGETVDGIAAEYGVGPSAIYDHEGNHLDLPCTLVPGQKLMIQVTTVEPQGFDLTTSRSLPTRQASQVVGVSAELIEFFRFQNRITVKVRLINTSKQSQIVFSPTARSYVLDEATGRKYPMTEESNKDSVRVPEGSSVPIWAKYEISEEDEPKYLTVALGNGILFDRLEVSYKRAE